MRYISVGRTYQLKINTAHTRFVRHNFFFSHCSPATRLIGFAYGPLFVPSTLSIALANLLIMAGTTAGVLSATNFLHHVHAIERVAL